MKLKVGQKIVFYNNAMRLKGTITEITPSGMISVLEKDFGINYLVHPKQCYLPKKRRRVWLNKTGYFPIVGQKFAVMQAVSEQPDNASEWIEFVEVKQK